MPEATQNANGGAVGIPVGSKIGKYEIKERFAVGGQAIVYKGYDAMLDRFVAIKQIATSLAEDPQFVERFRKEAQILARLGSEQQAIVTIHELIEESRGLFIVMEWVAGHTLETTLRDDPGPVSPKATLQVIWRLAAALYNVHQAGIIHRDIKPSNIIISEGLRPKITDFGAAASIVGQTAMLMGTTKYMAPELFAGGVADGRADLYSLGMIAYEMLLGRTKFNEIFADQVRDPHSEALRWMKWHGNDQVSAPPLHEVDPTIPRPLSELVAKMMAKKLPDRFQSMEDLGRAIKMTFSPRSRGAEAGPSLPARQGALGPGRAGIGPGDEVDELEVADATPTAALPKEPMPLATKLLIGAAVAVVVLGPLVYWIYVRGQEGRNNAKKVENAYALARDAYKDKNYAEALKGFQDVTKRFAGTLQAEQAAVLLPLTEAHLVVETAETTDDWQKAATLEAKAGDLATDAQRRKPQLTEWVRDVQNQIKDFGDERAATKKFREAVAKARKDMERNAFDDARAVLHSDLAGMDLSPKQKAERDALVKQIDLTEFRTNVTDLMHKGDESVQLVKFPDANTAYSQVLALLASPQAEVMDLPERRGITDSLTAKRADMARKRDLAEARAGAEKAHQEGNKEEELTFREKEAQLAPGDAAAAQRVAELRSSIAYGNAVAVIDKDPEQARALLKEALKYNPGNELAKAKLQEMDRLGSVKDLLAAAETAFSGGKYEEAQGLFEKAAALAPSEETAARIVECRFKAKLAEADKLQSAKKYDEALAAYDQAEQIKPSEKAAIAALVDGVNQKKEADALVAKIKDALEHNDFSAARKALTDLQKAQGNSQEVDLWTKETGYKENKSKGDDAAYQNDFKAALSLYGIAKRLKDTPEINELIKETEKKVPK